jgi:hypothetical protein
MRKRQRQAGKRRQKTRQGEVAMRVSFVLLLIVAMVSLAIPQIKSEQDAVNVVAQPKMSIRGDSISWTSNQYAPVHYGPAGTKTVRSCKGAVLLPTASAAGYLAVHLTGDASGKWYKMYLSNDGVPVGAEFDAVGDSTKGTTVARDTNLYIFPYLYKSP